MFEKLPRPLLIAHRGASLAAPENTLEAFELASRLGADVLELDVQRSRDGVLVVIHDATLERTTDGRGAVCAQDLAALKALDAGYHHRSSTGAQLFRDRDVRIPTLDEVLSAFAHMAFNIEMKSTDPLAIDALLRCLRGVDPARVVLAAGNDEVMARLEAAASPFALGLARGQVWQLVRAAYLGDLEPTS